MTDSVLDILIFVFDRYMLAATPVVPAREHLARDLERAGFQRGKVERALDWLSELACSHERTAAAPAGCAARSLRVFVDSERWRLSRECRGLLLTLEQSHIISAPQREIVIERLLALEGEELSAEQLQWVVLMVLSSQPGQQRAVEQLGGLAAHAPGHAPH
jgi:Smg protein